MVEQLLAGGVPVTVHARRPEARTRVEALGTQARQHTDPVPG
jgi:hypothetical protein